MAQISEEKRLKSLNKKKENYKHQKSAIQQALSNIERPSSKKILFDDNPTELCIVETENQLNNNKRKLFDDDEVDDLDQNFAESFNVKKQFEGKKGQKLLALQTKFQSDERFKFDERFNENEETNDINVENGTEDEKTKQLEILSQIVGKKIKVDKFEKRSEKGMLRFDPSKPDHNKYEINEEISTDQIKKKSKQTTEPEETSSHSNIASKATFFKITDNLKKSLSEKSSFSLLSSFGVADNIAKDESPNDYSAGTISKHKNRINTNSFHCESTDSEGEEQNGNANVEEQKSLPSHSLTNVGGVWRDNFFFSRDDQRLKDGCAFILKSQEEKRYESFAEVRQKIKSIVRTKVRNSEHKRRPFQKKLGGKRFVKHRR